MPRNASGDHQLTTPVAVPTQPTPADVADERTAGTGWWRSAAIYQVYVRSFADGNGDGVGDLAGIRAHLGYLRDLGVDAVWFTPWYPSPMADAGYDVADYRAIDPVFGTLEEADSLIAEAHGYGIKIIVDIVPNHLSDQHAWFQEALRTPPGSAQRDRFWFRPGKGGTWRTATQRLAVHLRRPGLDPYLRRRRQPGGLVPAPVRSGAARPQLGRAERPR
jgi:alpha-glucosidase